MNDALYIAVVAVLGLAVGWALRPSMARFETSAPVGVVEITTAVVFGVSAWRYEPWEVIPFLVLGAGCVALAAVDLAHFRLPNALVFPTTVGVVAVVFVGELVDGRSSHVIAAIVGAAFFTGFLFLFHLASPASLGFGDVKLAVVLGWVIGWVAGSKLDAVAGVMYALLIGSALGVVLGLLRRVVAARGGSMLHDPLGEASSVRATTFPFGPPLMIGAFVVAWFPATFFG